MEWQVCWPRAGTSSNSFRCSSDRCWCWGISIQRVSKATEDSIASVDRFATNTEGKVSSSTKKVLGEYFKLSDGIRQKLTEIRLNHEVITEEQSQKLIGQYDKLGNTIIEKQMQDSKKKWRDLKVLCGFVCTDC